MLVIQSGFLQQIPAMKRYFLLASFIFASLTSCDRLVKIVKDAKKTTTEKEIRITSEAKPEIVAAFNAIYKAAYEHNRVFLENVDAGKPANEPSYRANIEQLSRSAREHGGLTKQIIDAVSSSCNYEKDLFTPFDIIGRQLKGMPSWSNNQATQLRGYIQIMDQTILIYDGAVSYLERGERPLFQRNFDRYKVPKDISAEFLRLQELNSSELRESQLGMFREQRDALQSRRDALTSLNLTVAKQHADKAEKHEAEAKKYESQMIAELRENMKGAVRL